MIDYRSHGEKTNHIQYSFVHDGNEMVTSQFAKLYSVLIAAAASSFV